MRDVCLFALLLILIIGLTGMYLVYYNLKSSHNETDGTISISEFHLGFKIDNYVFGLDHKSEIKKSTSQKSFGRDICEGADNK